MKLHLNESYNYFIFLKFFLMHKAKKYKQLFKIKNNRI